MVEFRSVVSIVAIKCRAFASSPEKFLHFLFGLFLFNITLNAWTGDDAYITFRTVDNFLNGHGLRWNVDERVQSFTHPLWLCCVIAFSALSSDIWVSTIVLSITVSSITFYLLLFNQTLAVSFRILLALILIFSKAFVEYSTSGLENPLTHLLLALFFIISLRPEHGDGNTRTLTMLVALLATNRIDSLLIPLPLFALLLYKDGEKRGLKRVLPDLAIGALPFVAWEIFSLTYYGFLAPNTAYAKLGASQERGYLLVHGFLYFGESIIRDPLTLFGICTGLFWVVTARSRTHSVALLGPALYLLYILNIGGDFMSGRFLTAPLFASLVIGATAAPHLSAPEVRRTLTAIAASGAYVIFLSHALVLSLCPFSEGEKGIPLFGINDEAHYYSATNSLRGRLVGLSPADHVWAREGASLRRSGNSSTVVHGNIGLLGYYAGPRVTIIDFNALSDPLLARLPARSHRDTIGHFERDLPEGYLESTAMRSNVMPDRPISRYYEHLDLITKGDLFSLERLKEIIRFNTGTYNRLRELYTIGYIISRIEGRVDDAQTEQIPCVSSYSWGDSQEKPLLPECGTTPTIEQKESLGRIS